MMKIIVFSAIGLILLLIYADFSYYISLQNLRNNSFDQKERATVVAATVITPFQTVRDSIILRHWPFNASCKALPFIHNELVDMGLSTNGNEIQDLFTCNGNLVSQYILLNQMLNNTCLHQVLNRRNMACPQNLISQNLKHKLYKKSLSSSGKRYGSAHYKSWAENVIGQAPFRAYTNETENRNIECYLAEDTEIYPSHGKFNVVSDDGTISLIGISSLRRSKISSLVKSASLSSSTNYVSLNNDNYIGGIAILIDSFTDSNIFHQFYFSGIPFAALAATQRYPNSILFLLNRTEKVSLGEPWIANLVTELNSRSPSFHNYKKQIDAATNHDSNERRFIFDTVRYVKYKSYHGPYRFNELEIYRAPSADMQALHKALSKAPDTDLSGEPIVLIVQREYRRLADSETGEFSTIIDALCAMGLPVHVSNLGALSPAEQAKLLRRTSVLIGVHGADLTNMLYMSLKSTVIEVTLRYGWCCDPVTESSFGNDAPPCITEPCKPYHKVDYMNMAHALGINYFYFDAEYIDPPFGVNPIYRESVLVNSEELALLATTAYTKCTMKFQ